MGAYDDKLNLVLFESMKLDKPWTLETYRKIGGRVVYALDDLKAWADLGAKSSTSDPGVGTVLPAKRVAAPIKLAPHSYRR